MDLLKQTKRLCGLYGINPNRSKGQNFLIDDDIYRKIVKTSDLKKDDVVLEVGPGLGFLTEKLAKKAKEVIAVELDDGLANILKTRMAEQGIRNVEIINSDILKIPNSKFQIPNKFNPAIMGGTKFKIVANLPYNITSIFLRKFLSGDDRVRTTHSSRHDRLKPEFMILMLQKEVAERITACPPKMSLLAVSVQFYSKPEIIEYVDKKNFWPKPAVDSAIVKIVGAGQCPVQNEKKFFQLVKLGFSARRKMLKNNLAAGLMVAQKEVEERIKIAGFNPKVRAQELSLKDWTKIFNIFKCG